MCMILAFFSLCLAAFPRATSAHACASDNGSCAADEMLASQMQHKHVASRTHGSLQGGCASAVDVVDGWLCYPKCVSGYTGIDLVCWQNCLAAFTNDGAFSAKPAAYGRGWGFAAWHNDECNQRNSSDCKECLLMWYPSCESNFHAVGCNICSPICPDNMVDIGGVFCCSQFMRAPRKGQVKAHLLPCPLEFFGRIWRFL